MTAMDKYFVVEPGAEPHGPYPLPEIADLLASGTVTPRAILRKAGDASAPPRPTVIDVAPIEPMRPAAPPPSPRPSPPPPPAIEAAPPPVPQPPPVPESAKAPAAKAMMEKAKRVGPPPGVTPPQATVVA